MSSRDAQADPMRTSTERLPLMRDRSGEERQAFFERHDTYWV
jgi:hypothetical protein